MCVVYVELKGECFDVLLQMQVVLCFNLFSLGICVEWWIGYDCVCLKDLYSLVVNECILVCSGEYVFDVIGSFCELLGLKQIEVCWDIFVFEVDCIWVVE